MDHQDMHFLDVLRIVRGDYNRNVREVSHIASVPTEQGDALQPQPVRCFESLHHIARTAARAYAQQHVTRSAECFYVPGKYVVIAHIVGPCRETTGIRVERDGG